MPLKAKQYRKKTCPDCGDYSGKKVSRVSAIEELDLKSAA